MVVSPLMAQRMKDFKTPLPLRPGDTLIIGFLGGWEHWDNPIRGVNQLAVRLREQAPRGVYVETVENHKRSRATALIRRALDRNRNGRLDPDERAGARIILYGQSLGGSTVVRVARELEALQVPVLLTVQIDSVGLRDGVIPANVFAAANFFQREAWPLAGQKSIRAADPARTRILTSEQVSYRGKEVDISMEPRWRQVMGRAHIKMEHDPEVWQRVEQMILAAIPIKM